ncbi:MAG: DNA recombination protein RmuC [Candidatus Niyogibacteria bacterium CG10_big_fil_rev_8_21_14_0_10_42_19]|uniref:DNA recombination protein RmuC n=1 Tax=Candidatus Niyogibacteria bacterium CG10_big_fil_rev_8_21_14_0_10_42_19 TaxID=1974725 RepID=A0A2H0TFU3_9BACT|nr:MAG: DNA recombination protein RmuC [Candidatus Niyogibacteria bacterium CG10_big_fil_rev_8_21_14_0_10_42_19]
MNIFLTLVIFTFGIIGGGALVYFLTRKSESFVMLQGHLQDISRQLDEKLSHSSRMAEHQFSESSKIIRDVTERLTKLDETNKQVTGFAEQLRSLQDVLQNPKQRGVLGEYYLETVLKNVLPPGSYQMQYKFSDGTIVDAVIFLKDQIIPIDSKFSLENYNRLLVEKDPQEREKIEKQFRNDLKMRIDETSKYIKPQEQTLDFAFMFIPSEAIYYDLLVNQVGAVKVDTGGLVSYAVSQKRVFIVSPTTFFAYLQAVLQGLKAMKIEESAKEIRQRVGELSKHLLSYDDYMQKLGKNMGVAVGSYNQAYKEFKKIDKDVVRIGAEAGGIEPITLEKPIVGELED